MVKALFVISSIGAVLGGLMLVGTFVGASSAPQQGAEAAIAIGLAVIPYCLARSVQQGRDEVARDDAPSRPKKLPPAIEKALAETEASKPGSAQ